MRDFFGGCSRRIERSVTLLPEPDSPSNATHLAGAKREIDAIEGAHRFGAAGEGHREALDVENRAWL